MWEQQQQAHQHGLGFVSIRHQHFAIAVGLHGGNHARLLHLFDQPRRAVVADHQVALLADRNFIDAVPGHLSPDASSQRRVTQLTARIRELAALGGNGKTD